ncbi:MAG: PqiA/YebS family transporter subunit [Nevskia sp.]|nr:PqiA/YebS family transporter subunit [Nevskia sp.]
MSTTHLIICEFCDSVYRRAPLQERAVARCSRCSVVLHHASRADLDAMLALALAALIVLAVANAYPLMTLSVGSKHSEATLWRMIVDTYDSNVAPIAVVAALTVFFFPLLQACLYAYVLLPLRRGRVPAAFVGVMHALRQMQPWTMVEVFMLGLLVAVVKLGDMATAVPGIGLWGFAVLTFLLTVLNSADLEELWARAAAIELAAGGDEDHLRPLPVEAPPELLDADAATPAPPVPRRIAAPPRAADLGLIGCTGCGLVLRAGRSGGSTYCPRCDQALRRRKPDGHRRSWAFLIAAAILYVPANVLPVMRTSTLLDSQNNTILSGVVELWENGAWDLAVIVFTASIAVPLVKISCMALLLVGSGRRSLRWQRERTRIYRLVEFIGRWSMLDVFVVALLLSLVRFGILAQVQAGAGIVAFCAVVVLTMLATMSYDPRTIWDAGRPAVPARQPEAVATS